MENSLMYYTQQSVVTNPGKHQTSFDELPGDIATLVKIVQGLITHRDSSHLYGLELTEKRKNEGETRYVSQILERIIEYDSSSLKIIRPPEKRFSGTCRDFQVLLCSILRYKGIPARVRCGFAGYFTDKWEDHWLCEYWNNQQGKWILVDANVDDVECKAYNVTLDILNVPHDKFIFAGTAWQRCRKNKVDPQQFGVSSINIFGIWFVRNNVIRDLAALNRMEMLPWDEWGLADKEFDIMTENELKLIDEAAQLTINDSQFTAMRNLYESKEVLRVPKIVKSHTTYSGVQMVKLKSAE